MAPTEEEAAVAGSSAASDNQGRAGEQGGEAPTASPLGFPRWCHSLGGAEGWSLGCHALRGPLARGKELDPEPCTGTVAVAAAEQSWCLGTCTHCPSLRGDKHGVRLWRGRTSTGSTSRRDQERRGVLPYPELQAWELGTAPKPGPGPLCHHTRLCTGVECLVSLLPPNLCISSAPKPLLQELKVPAAPLCVPPGTSPHAEPWDGCRHLWRVRAGNEALLPVAGRDLGAQSHPAHLGQVKESKLAKPAPTQLAWFGSAAGETRTAGKREHGQGTWGVKEVRRRGSGWPGCSRAPSHASWLWGRCPEV